MIDEVQIAPALLPAIKREVDRNPVPGRFLLTISGSPRICAGDPAALARSPQLGPLLETFAVQEVKRHLRCADTAVTAWHFRTAAGQEVDLVLETPAQRVVGIEVKASASLNHGDFRGLRELADAAGTGFARGIVLYTGEQLMPFDTNLWAVPLGVLWAGGGGAT